MQWEWYDASSQLEGGHAAAQFHYVIWKRCHDAADDCVCAAGDGTYDRNSYATAADDLESQARLQAFLQGLRAAGWVEGRNMRVETRWIDGDPRNEPEPTPPNLPASNPM